MEKEKSCGALVYSVQGDRLQLLLIRHKQGGHWSFPKGHVEFGETEIETAVREVKEETGVDIQVQHGFRETVRYSPRPGATKDVVYFLGYAQDTHTVRQEEEISELGWVEMDSAKRYLTYDNDKMLLSRARQFIQRHAGKLPGISR